MSADHITRNGRPLQKQQSALEVLVRRSAQSTTLLSQQNALDKYLDHELKKTTQKEKTKWKRFQRNGQNLFHSRAVLLFVVTLTVIDCLLVIGELILDINYMKSVVDRYSAAIDIYRSAQSNNHSIERRSSDPNSNDPGNLEVLQEEHMIEEEVAHGLHYASVAILGILAIETSFKICFFGRGLFKRKLEVFDAFIVYASFVVDVVLIKEGLTTKPLTESAFILSFLLPWRVVRVVNSLLVAMLDRENFKLLLVYISKKRIQKEMDETMADLHVTRRQVHAVKNLCTSLGAKEWVINQKLGDVGRPSVVTPDELTLFKQQHLQKKKMEKKMQRQKSWGFKKKKEPTDSPLRTISEKDNDGFEDDNSSDIKTGIGAMSAVIKNVEIYGSSSQKSTPTHSEKSLPIEDGSMPKNTGVDVEENGLNGVVVRVDDDPGEIIRTVSAQSNVTTNDNVNLIPSVDKNSESDNSSDGKVKNLDTKAILTDTRDNGNDSNRSSSGGTRF